MVTPNTLHGAVAISVPTAEFALENPQEWNERWEKLVSSRTMTSSSFIDNYSLLYGGYVHGQAAIDKYMSLLSSTLMLGRDISGRVRAPGFDVGARMWISASVPTRKKHILVGMSEAGGSAHNLNDSRVHTGDILTLSHLSNDGNVLVDLLQSIPVDQTTLQNFPGKVWDEFLKNEERRPRDEARETLLGEVKVLRTKLIYFTIWFTFLSFLDLDRPKIAVQKNRRITPEEKKQVLDHKKQYKEVTQAVVKPIKQSPLGNDLKCRPLQQFGKVVQCQHCEKMQPPDCPKEEKFPRCSRCWDQVGRTVNYCNRTCQVAAYKAKHKAICGKELDFKAATEAAVSLSKRNT